jgi:hypothetical protein
MMVIVNEQLFSVKSKTLKQKTTPISSFLLNLVMVNLMRWADGSETYEQLEMDIK